MHSAKDAAFDQPDLWEMLSQQVQAGKIRHVGLSISPNDNLYQTAGATAAGAETIQVVYNRLDRAPEAAVLPSCQAQDLGVLARVPLASGLLTGKYRPGDVFDNPDDIRSQRSPSERRTRCGRRPIAATEVPPGVPMAAWALAWCLRHPAVACVIPGCKTVGQVTSNAHGADLADGDHPLAWGGS